MRESFFEKASTARVKLLLKEVGLAFDIYNIFNQSIVCALLESESLWFDLEGSLQDNP